MVNIILPQYNAVTIQLTDITGRIVKQITSSGSQVALPVGELSNGVYFCTIIGRDFSATRKIMISK
jgi:hypothetical protein